MNLGPLAKFWLTQCRTRVATLWFYNKHFINILAVILQCLKSYIHYIINSFCNQIITWTMLFEVNQLATKQDFKKAEFWYHETGLMSQSGRRCWPGKIFLLIYYFHFDLLSIFYQLIYLTIIATHNYNHNKINLNMFLLHFMIETDVMLLTISNITVTFVLRFGRKWPLFTHV